MGYDLEPMRTLESKRALLRDAAGNGWRFIFQHDPEVILGRVEVAGKEVYLAEVARRPGT
jgi:lipoate-protein ligase A